MFIDSHRSLRASLLLLALGAPAIALAQAPPPNPTPAPQPEAAEPAPDPSDSEVSLDGVEQDGDEGEVIVVTGSAIRRKIADTPAPVAVLDRVDIDASGLVSVGDILQNLPAQSNAINVQFNNGGTGATRISLRGLGSNRTLVLVNGRRHVPGGTGANSAVDLNAIPTAVIERIEVVKDGASAVYGSDAVGGVVNIITRTDFTGTEATGYIASTGDGLGSIYDLNVTAGHSSDKGSILFAAGYYNQGEMFADDRSYSRSDKSFDYFAREGDDPVSTAGSIYTPHGTIIDFTGAPGNDLWEQVVAENCPSGFCFNDPETGWRDFANTGNFDVAEGDFYNYQPENYLVTPQERYNVFSTGNYKFGQDIRGFFEASYTNRRSQQKLAPTPLATFFEDISVSPDNIYNPFGREFLFVGRRMVETQNRDFTQNIDTFRAVVGLEGQAPRGLSYLRENGWRWELSYNFGRTEGTSINEGRFVRSRVAAALGPSFVDGDGTFRCGSPSNPIGDCVPLNLFGGPGTITEEMLDYISYTGTATGFTEQQSILFNSTGKLFDTPWGGDVRIAVGAEYRDHSGGFQPDPLTEAGDTTGTATQSTNGSYDVREGYVELSAVPVIGKPGVQWLELTAAGRVFDYNTFGRDQTWKAGGLWRPHKAVAVRGTYSTAFRAPSVGELFAGQQDGFPSATDPCNDTDDDRRTPNEMANCEALGVPAGHFDPSVQLRSRFGGNPDVKPETANIFTTGLVLEPPMIEGLAFTLDYFNIEIDNAIQTRGAGVILSQCYSVDPANRDDTACALIERNPTTNSITNIINTISNIGGTETAGFDFNVRYDHTTPIGRFRHNLEGTWLQKYNQTQPDPNPEDPANPLATIKGKGVYDLGAFPELRTNVSTLWGYKQFGAGVNVRFISGFMECANNDCDTELAKDPDPELDPSSDDPEVRALFPGTRDVDANVTADIFASYTLKSPLGDSKLTIGVNNALNTKPAVVFNGFQATSDAATYDFLGRFFYARLVQSF